MILFSWPGYFNSDRTQISTEIGLSGHLHKVRSYLLDSRVLSKWRPIPYFIFHYENSALHNFLLFSVHFKLSSYSKIFTHDSILTSENPKLTWLHRAFFSLEILPNGNPRLLVTLDRLGHRQAQDRGLIHVQGLIQTIFPSVDQEVGRANRGWLRGWRGRFSNCCRLERLNRGNIWHRGRRT